MQVLIVDEQALFRGNLRARLEGHPNIVICAEAADVGEALELATQHKPHVAVVAVSLPLLKGLEVNRGIRRGSPLTQVLALSSQEREDLISMALAAGAQSWLIKTAVTSLLESVARDRKEPHVERREARRLARDAHC